VQYSEWLGERGEPASNYLRHDLLRQLI
jgi:hypothetical protein